MDKDAPVLTIPDVAKILQVSEKTINRMLQEGSIPGFKVVNQWRFHPEDFDHWLKAKRAGRDGIARAGIATMLSQELDTVPLSRLTEIDLIVTDIPPGPKEEILQVLTQPLFERGVVEDTGMFVSGLLAREAMMSTGVGGGIALPHLRNPQNQPVDRPLIVIGVCPKGTEWDSIDRFPVNLFLLPLTGNEVLHLKTLAAIRRALVVDGIIDMFIEAKTPQDVLSVLIKIETIQQTRL